MDGWLWWKRRLVMCQKYDGTIFHFLFWVKFILLLLLLLLVLVLVLKLHTPVLYTS